MVSFKCQGIREGVYLCRHMISEDFLHWKGTPKTSKIVPDFDAPKFQKYAPVMPLRQPPGPPPGPVPPRFNPMGIPMPPMPVPSNDGGAVISSAPVIRKDREQTQIGPQAPSVVSAAPQLRNLRKETVKLVPVVLKRKPTEFGLSQSKTSDRSDTTSKDN
ncbi:hypothetical protein KIN20_004783 [Parelaphostrongylus tenuis]|uniref:Uncharacterized protein n=1 Tax=Parelaphostrongylus tenuis TaxID=148309 RepID=A0AAD5MKA7_PARTN|nr:hypothetical protein KIN20_004783 [Parelaphostrongylus tenuis]